MLSLLDPYPVDDRRSTMNKHDYEEIERGRDAAQVARRRAILLTFGDALLHATWLLTKRRYRERFEGHYAIDGSSFATYAKGPKKRGQLHSVERDAGWYRRGGDHKGDPGTVVIDRLAWAFEATIVTTSSTTRDSVPDYPLVALSLGLGRPGVDPAGMGVASARSIRDQGLPGKYLIADRLYWAGQDVEQFHHPLGELGFKAVTDYRRDQLGIQDSYEGAVMVEGEFYCPGKFCTNQASLTFPATAGAKWKQPLLFGSDEWENVYGCGRNTIESYNASIKNQMGLPGDRRTRTRRPAPPHRAVRDGRQHPPHPEVPRRRSSSRDHRPAATQGASQARTEPLNRQVRHHQ
jgi:hypothetical protein